MLMLSSTTLLLLIAYAGYALLLLLWQRKQVKKADHQDGGVYQWLVLVSLFLPLLGPILGLIAYHASKKYALDTVSSYDEYIHFQHENYKELEAEAKRDLQLLPFMAGLQAENPAIRKDLIVRLLESEIVNRGKYLRLALHSPDTEAVHYAATTLTFLKDTYEKRIEALKKKRRPDNVGSYLQLSQAYQAYIASGIPYANLEQRIFQEFLDVTQEAIKYFPEHKEYMVDLVELNKKLGPEEKWLLNARQLITRFPHAPEGYLQLMAYYFNKGEIAPLPGIYQQLMQHVEENTIPPQYLPILDQIRRL